MTSMTERRRLISNWAREKMNEYGLGQWVFGFDRSTSRYGVCKYTYATIERKKGKDIIKLEGVREIILSEFVMQYTDFERDKETVLHEIAHAMVAESGVKETQVQRMRYGGKRVVNRPHGIIWQRMALRVGASRERCGAVIPEIAEMKRNKPYKWTGTCPECDNTWNRRVLREKNRLLATCPKCAAYGKRTKIYGKDGFYITREILRGKIDWKKNY